MSVTPPARRRGRHAEGERNDRLVLEAAREVFASQGAEAPVSAIAKRAGVGMGSLYRRYGSKTEMLQRLCILAMHDTIAAAERGLQAQEAWKGLAGYIRECVAFGSGALAPLAGAIETTPAMWELSRRGRQLLEELVARAQRAGGLRRDVTALDVAWLIEQFGRRPLVRRADDEDHVRLRLLSIAIDGLHARDAEPLPTPPPNAEQYEGRWQPPALTPDQAS